MIDDLNYIPAHITEFNNNPEKFIGKQPIKQTSDPLFNGIASPKTADYEGMTKVFLNPSKYGGDVNATCRKVVNAHGKTLNIWVANNSFGDGCGKSNCMTQDRKNIYRWKTCF